MFGYVTMYGKDLSPAVRDRYQAYYCGLCRALRRRYGPIGQLTLSYDMTFVALLLSALYEPPTALSVGRCRAHPLRTRPRAANEYVDYAADMTVVLAYYNALDDWQDEHSQRGRLLAARLQPRLPAIRRRWPQPCAGIEQQLTALAALESAGSRDLDALCHCFGTLLGAVLCPRGADMWAPALMGIGQGLGGFIYLMDAYDDLEKDARRGCFNALAFLAGQADFEARCQDLLTQQMALCAQSFALLPILKDSPEGALLYDILYAGVWSHYESRRARRNQHPAPAGGREEAADDRSL